MAGETPRIVALTGAELEANHLRQSLGQVKTYTSAEIALLDAATWGKSPVWREDGVVLLSDGNFFSPVVLTHDITISLCGQSNANGHGVLDANTEKSHPALLMLDKGENVVIASEPLGDQVAGWIDNTPAGVPKTGALHSFGLKMAKDLLLDAQIKTLLVPCAIGATNISQWMPTVNDTDMTTLFGAMNARMQKTRNTSAPVFCWFGHESNDPPTESLATGTQDGAYALAWGALQDEVFSRYPDAVFLYAQLSAHSTTGLATKLRQIGEAQRKNETFYGDGVSPISGVYQSTSVNTDPNLFRIKSQGNNNTMTIEGAGMRINGAGSTSSGFEITKDNAQPLDIGRSYRLNLSVTGTGVFRFSSSFAVQIGLSAGVHQINFTPAGSGHPGIFGDGTALNMLFVIDSIEALPVAQRNNSFMIVTHDVQRNNATDDIHISQTGLKTVGQRMALAYRQHVLGEVVNGTGPRLLLTDPVTKSGSIVTIAFDSTIMAPKEANWASNGVASNSNIRVYYDGVEQTVTGAVLNADPTKVDVTLSAAISGVVVVTYGDRTGPGDGTVRKGVIYDSDSMPAPVFGPLIAV